MKTLRKVISGIMLCTISFYTMPVLALTNEESIYSKLKNDGERYKTIVSTTVDDENTQNETDKELPVECKITYELDGKEISADEIAGKSGNVKIKLEYENKEEHEVNVNGKTEKMYTPFLVVAGAIIQNDNNSEIEVSNGKVVNDGSKTIVMGVALPGMQESIGISEEDLEIPSYIEISLNTTKFEMGNIITFCTPKVLDDDIDISENLDEVYSQMDSLKDASTQIQDGSSALKDGIIALNDGVITLNNGAGELQTGVSTLKDGSNSLENGAITLKNGTAEYTAKSKEFNGAMNKVAAGVTEVNSNYQNLNAGINSLNSKTSELNAGAAQISGGLAQASSGVSKINQTLSNDIKQGLAGVNQLDGAAKEYVIAAKQALSSLNTSVDNQAQINTLNAKKTENSALITELSSARDNLIAQSASLEAQSATLVDVAPEAKNAIDSAKASIDGEISRISNTINSLSANNSEIESAINGLTPGGSVDLSPVSGALDSAISYISKASETTSAVSGGVDSILNGPNGNDGSQYLEASLGALTSGAQQLASGTSALVSGVSTLSNGANALQSGISTLDSSSKQLASANNELTSASGVISKGASDLADGTIKLNSGIDSLALGANKLKDGSNTLADGSAKLVAGAEELDSGIKKFNSDGIDKIYKYVNVDLKKITNRIEKLQDLSNDYNSFVGSEKRDHVQFINIIDSVKMSAKDESNEDIIVDEKK